MQIIQSCFLRITKCIDCFMQQIIQYYKHIRQIMDTQSADIQFYLMKIGRLQSDLSAMHNQLLSVRLRLRTAQDYQIKYELLLKQSEEDSQRFKMFQMQQQQKIGQLIAIKLKQRQLYWSEKLTKIQKQQAEKYNKQLSKIGQDFAAFRKKHERCGNKFDQQDILSFKNKKLQKQLEILEQQIVQINKNNQKFREEQIRKLKQSMQAKNKEKQQGQRKIYRQKIENLEAKVVNLQNQLFDAKSKADPRRENQIQSLKKQLSFQSRKTNEQLQKINISLNNKSQQIQEILMEKHKTEEKLINQKKDLKEYIKDLQNKMFEKQKQHQIQLIHLKQRMNKIREDEAQIFKSQINKIQERYHQQRDSWGIVLKDKDNQIQRITNKINQDTQRHKQDKAKQLRKIQELKQRLKQFEQNREAGQTQNILKSMKQITAKQQDFANYQNGVTFLDRQLKKALSKVQQKGIQITKLIKELNQLRKQSQDEINSLKQKLRKDKKYYSDKIGDLQVQNRELNDQTRNKDRQMKRREKDMEGKINLLNKQNQSLKDLVEELQKDYSRAIENKKALETSYRQERQKGMTSKTDLSMAKKQKWMQIERQKNDLEVVFKQKQQQLKNRFQVQMQKLRHQRDQLRTQNEKLKGLVEVRSQSSANKQNKESVYTQYNKKMATLNLQIALTKNIYNALMQAKSRKVRNSKGDKSNQLDEMNQDVSNSDQNEQNRDEKQPAFMNYSDLQKMTMSFNPKQI